MTGDNFKGAVMRPTALWLSFTLGGFLAGASWRAPWHWPLWLAGAVLLACGCWLLVEAISERRELLRAVEEAVASDDVHAWLTRMRDRCDRTHPAWTAVDWLIGDLERRPSLAPEHDRQGRP